MTPLYPKFDTTEWEVLSTHLENLQALNEAEKVTYLAQVKEESPHLYEWVQKLASVDAAYEAALDEALAPVEQNQFLTPLADLKGQQMGQYVLLEKIGEGGMGEVYLAQRTDDFEQKVAIKILRYAFLNPRLARRFEKEQHLLARLQHPSIANFIDAGLSANGIPFLVMEYVNGQDLRTYAASHRPTIATQIGWILQICEALQYLHTNLVVHRDLKPSNILVLPNERIKMLDFGIAKVLETANAPDEHTQTQPFQYVLTPNYASPEQLWGKPISALSDVYGLGVVLYELLTDQLPYQVAGKNLVELETVFKEPPPLPSLIGEKSGIKLAKDLDTIVLKTLSFEPSQRYGSVAALAEDLQRWLKREPILAKPQTWSYRLSRFVARNRVLVLMAMLLFVTLSGSLAFTLWQAGKIKDESNKSGEVLAFLEQVLAGYDPFSPNPAPQDLKATQQLVQNSLAYLNDLPKTHPEVRIRIFNLLSGIAFSRSQTQLADSLNQIAQKEIKQTVSSTYLQVETFLHTAKINWLKQAFKEGIKAADQGLLLATSEAPEILKKRRELLNIKNMLHLELGALEAAKTALDEANSITEKVYNAQSLEYAQQLGQKAAIAGYEEEYKTAVVLLEKVIEIYRLNKKENHHFVSTAYNNLSLALKYLGKKEEALLALDQSIQISEKIFGTHHKEVITSQINKATTLYEFGQLEQSVALLKKILPFGEQIGGETLQSIYYNLAFILQDQGKLAEAEQWGKKALVSLTNVVSPDHPDVLRTESLLGEVLRESNRLLEAESYFQKVIQTTQEQQPPSPRYVRALLKVAWIRFDQNQTLAAEKLIAQVKEAMPKIQPPPMLSLELEAIEAWALFKKGNRLAAKQQMETVYQKLQENADADIVLKRMLLKRKNSLAS